MLLERHGPPGDPIPDYIIKDPPHGGQADPVHQDLGKGPHLIQVLEDVLEKLAGFLIVLAGDDPRGVHDAVHGAEAVQGTLRVGLEGNVSHFLQSFRAVPHHLLATEAAGATPLRAGSCRATESAWTRPHGSTAKGLRKGLVSSRGRAEGCV